MKLRCDAFYWKLHTCTYTHQVQTISAMNLQARTFAQLQWNQFSCHFRFASLHWFLHPSIMLAFSRKRVHTGKMMGFNLRDGNLTWNNYFSFFCFFSFSFSLYHPLFILTLSIRPLHSLFTWYAATIFLFSQHHQSSEHSHFPLKHIWAHHLSTVYRTM